MSADRRLRVLLVLGSSAGGVVRHVAQVFAALREQHFEVRVAGPGLLAPHFESGVFHPVEIGSSPGLVDVVSVRRLRGLGVGADAVHAHGLRAGALVVLATRLLPRRRRPRVAVTLHNLPVGSRWTALVSGVLLRVVARGADVVLGVSSDIIDEVVRMGARDTARALVPAPQRAAISHVPESFRDQLVGPESGAVVLTVARLAQQKGLDTLLLTARILRDKGVLFTWLVAGSGPLRDELSAVIEQEALPVRLLGARADVPELLRTADVVVSTAVWEGQPIGIQEALHAGVAIVATDAGGTREVTCDAARIVPVGDAPALADQISELLGDGTARAELAARALARAQELPTSDQMVAQLIAVYGEAGRS